MAQRKATKATRRDALAVCYMAWNRFRDQRFAISSKSPNFPALLAAQTENWIWFPTPKTAVLTAQGIEALRPYGVQPE